MTRRENEGKKNKMYGENGYVVSSFVVSCVEGSSDDFLTRTRGLGFPRTPHGERKQNIFSLQSLGEHLALFCWIPKSVISEEVSIPHEEKK